MKTVAAASLIYSLLSVTTPGSLENQPSPHGDPLSFVRFESHVVHVDKAILMELHLKSGDSIDARMVARILAIKIARAKEKLRELQGDPSHLFKGRASSPMVR